MILCMEKKRQTTWTPARLRALRKRLGLTQTEAGKKVGLTRRGWAYLEAGGNTSHPVEILLKMLEDAKI